MKQAIFYRLHVALNSVMGIEGTRTADRASFIGL